MSIATPAATDPVLSTSQQKTGILHLITLQAAPEDFLTFMDETDDLLFAYLYHRIGSLEQARTLLEDVYFSLLERAMSAWRPAKCTVALALSIADDRIKDAHTSPADIDATFTPTLRWLPEQVRLATAQLHEALWTMPIPSQRLLILSILMGLSEEAIARHLGMSTEQAAQALSQAREELSARWNPPKEMAQYLGSLVFLPALSILAHVTLRTKMLDKYRAIRMRRYQWVALGVFLAVFANFVVACLVLVTASLQPSVGGVSRRVAALEALQHEPQYTQYVARKAIQSLQDKRSTLVAYDTARTLNSLAVVATTQAQTESEERQKSIDRMIYSLQASLTFLPLAALW